MQFSKWFKYVWWSLLLVLCSVMIIIRFDDVKKGSLNSFDTVLIGVFALLALLPFFSEMSLLGFSLKKDISEFKNQVKEDVKELKSQINNTIGISNGFTPHIYLGPPPPSDEQLDKLEDRVKDIIKITLEEKGITKLTNINHKFDIPEDIQIMLFSRYQLEKELKRIWINRFDGHVNERNLFSISLMIKDLTINEILSRNLGGVIKEVYSICSSTIHGEEPSEGKIKFIKDVFPELIATLKQLS
jgi:hypothetical protein